MSFQKRFLSAKNAFLPHWNLFKAEAREYFYVLEDAWDTVIVKFHHISYFVIKRLSSLFGIENAGEELAMFQRRG